MGALSFGGMRVFVLFLVIAMGCGGPEPTASQTAGGARPAAASPSPPTMDDARALVEGSPEFSEYQFTNAAYTLPLSRAAMNAPALEVANQLKAAKWIGFDGAGNVVLTEKARADRRFLVRQNGVVDIVPLAKKEFLGVEAVVPGAEPAVDFRWKWVPNEIGASIKSGALNERYAGEKLARATLLRSGEAWTVLKIEPK